MANYRDNTRTSGTQSNTTEREAKHNTKCDDNDDDDDNNNNNNNNNGKVHARTGHEGSEEQ
jgi:hypothetical protein